jgi:hypothetical protein
MAPASPPDEEEEEEADDDWAIARVFALVELWALIAQHSGLVGAWRLKRVCKAAREGAKVWLRTLPGLVVCGGRHTWRPGDVTSAVLRLDLGELRWESMPDLTLGRASHACCAVRGGIVALGGIILADDESQTEEDEDVTASVEIVWFDSSMVLPPLQCAPIYGSVALAIDESESEQGQVLLIGGRDEELDAATSAVHKVDLATGVCTPQPSLLSHGHHGGCSAARLPDGRIVCVGVYFDEAMAAMGGWAQVLEPSEHGSSSEANSQWRVLPGMSVSRFASRGIVLSDGRFAVFGGEDRNHALLASCEVLTMDGDGERWEPLRPMREARCSFACAAIGGCVIVAGGDGSITVEVYEEALRQWRRLPCNLPDGQQINRTCGAAM